jgi:hypothetical protein
MGSIRHDLGLCRFVHRRTLSPMGEQGSSRSVFKGIVKDIMQPGSGKYVANRPFSLAAGVLSWGV